MAAAAVTFDRSQIGGRLAYRLAAIKSALATSQNMGTEKRDRLQCEVLEYSAAQRAHRRGEELSIELLEKMWHQTQKYDRSVSLPVGGDAVRFVSQSSNCARSTGGRAPAQNLAPSGDAAASAAAPATYDVRKVAGFARKQRKKAQQECTVAALEADLRAERAEAREERAMSRERLLKNETDNERRLAAVLEQSRADASKKDELIRSQQLLIADFARQKAALLATVQSQQKMLEHFGINMQHTQRSSAVDVLQAADADLQTADAGDENGGDEHSAEDADPQDAEAVETADLKDSDGVETAEDGAEVGGDMPLPRFSRSLSRRSSVTDFLKGVVDKFHTWKSDESSVTNPEATQAEYEK